MKQRNSAALRCVAIGLLLLAMLVAPLAPVAAQIRGNAPSGRCGHAVSTVVSAQGPAAGLTACGNLSPCTAAVSAMAMAMADDAGCPTPGPDGVAGGGDGCTAVSCHVMHIGLPLGDAPSLAAPSPAPVATPMTALPDGVGVDPALEPPRAFL